MYTPNTFIGSMGSAIGYYSGSHKIIDFLLKAIIALCPGESSFYYSATAALCLGLCRAGRLTGWLILLASAI
jgi:hypothetical protein